jgi:hypothetical protein
MSPVIVASVIAAPDPQVWAHLLGAKLERMSKVKTALQREEPRAHADPIPSSNLDVVLL